MMRLSLGGFKLKTLKFVGGDFVIENDELQMVQDDEEIAQDIQTLMSVRLGEFELDENIGLDRSVYEDKTSSDSDVTDSVLEALQPLTDQYIIEGADNIVMTKEKQTRKAMIELDIIKTDGSEINLRGVGIDGTD